MFLEKEQLDQIEEHITEILPVMIRRNPKIATTIEGILAEHFPRRDEFARLLDEFTSFRHETHHRFDRVDQEIHEVKGDIAVLKTDVAVLKTDVGKLNGSDLEWQIRERPFVYLSRFALKIRAVSDADLADLVEDALKKNRLSEKEAEDLKLIDVIARGRRRNDSMPLYLAVEASSVVDKHDLEQAVRRAALLARATDIVTMPVVIGEEVREDVRRKAEKVNAGWVVVN